MEKFEAGLIERDACSITVPDTRETLVYLIYPRNFHAALRSAPQAALFIFFYLFFARLITNVENLQDLSQTNMIYDVESDAMHV